MVHVGGGSFGLIWQGLAIEIVFENRFNTLIRTRSDSHGSPTSRLQTVVTIAFAQAHDAQTGAEAMLGMGTRGENGFDDLSACRAGFFGPPDETRRRPLGVVLVGLGHVGDDGGVTPFLR